MSDELAGLIQQCVETAVVESVSLNELKMALHDSYIDADVESGETE